MVKKILPILVTLVDVGVIIWITNNILNGITRFDIIKIIEIILLCILVVIINNKILDFILDKIDPESESDY